MEIGQTTPLLDTDEFVETILTEQKRTRQNEPPPGVFISLLIDAAGDRTFGRFFVYLLVMLGAMKLAAPDLGRYLAQIRHRALSGSREGR